MLQFALVVVEFLTTLVFLVYMNNLVKAGCTCATSRRAFDVLRGLLMLHIGLQILVVAASGAMRGSSSAFVYVVIAVVGVLQAVIFFAWYAQLLRLKCVCTAGPTLSIWWGLNFITLAHVVMSIAIMASFGYVISLHGGSAAADVPEIVRVASVPKLVVDEPIALPSTARDTLLRIATSARP